jgi:uncharacterized membrane protein YvlD (DUF360 family)
MDNLILLFTGYFIIGLVINMSTSTLVAILKPFWDIQKYSMVVAAIISAFIIVAYNQGIMTTLSVPLEISRQPMFHIVDLVVTSIIFTLGSQAVHKLIEGIEAYRKNKSE